MDGRVRDVGLPMGARAVYVRADAPADGADGTEAHPFRTIEDALRNQKEERWLLVAAGTYAAPLALHHPTHVWGLCAARTVVTGDASAPLVTTDAALELRDLTLRGGAGALHVTAGTTALRRVALDRAEGYGVLVEGSGARVEAEDLVARAVSAPREHGVLSVVRGGALDVTRAALLGVRAHGVRVDGSGSSATLRDVALVGVDATATASGIGLYARASATLTGERVVVDRATENCGYVTGGARLTLTDAVLRRARGFSNGTQGIGLVVDGRGHLEVTRGLVEDCRQTAVAVAGTGSEAALHDCVIRRTALGGDGTLGTGLGANDGGRITAERTQVIESHDHGVIAYRGGSSIELTGCDVRGTLPRRDGTQGVGVVAHTGTRVVLRQTLVRDNHAVGVIAYAAAVELHDVMITNTLSGEPGTAGAGLAAHTRGQVTGDHVALSNNIDAALESYGPGSAATLSDVLIRPLDDGTHPRGLGALASAGGAVTLARAAVVDVDGVGVASLVGDGTPNETNLTATDLFVSTVEPRTLWMGSSPVAFALSVERARMALTRATVLGGEYGFVVAEGSLTLDDAVVRDASRNVGVVNASPAVDLGTTTATSPGGGVVGDVAVERVRVQPPPPPGT